MNLFNLNPRNTAATNHSMETREINVSLAEILNTSKVSFKEEAIMQIPIVSECIDKIATQIASMPVHCFIEDQNGIVKRQLHDYREFLLNDESNPFTGAYELKYKIAKDMLLHGKSYVYLEKQGHKILGLHHVDFLTVSEKVCTNNLGIVQSKDIFYTLNNRVLSADSTNFLIFESGKEGILHAKEVIEIFQKYNISVKCAIDSVATPSGILSANGRLTKDAVERLRKSWEQMYNGTRSSAKTVILEEGLSYKPLEINLDNINSTELKKSLVEDVQRLFGLYDIKNYDEFLKLCLSGPINAFECSLNRALLLEREKRAGYFFRMDCSELLRPQTKEMYELASLAVKSGFMSIEECRKYLDMERWYSDESYDVLTTSLGNVFQSKDGTIQIPNMGITVKPDGTFIKQEVSSNGTILGA